MAGIRTGLNVDGSPVGQGARKERFTVAEAMLVSGNPVPDRCSDQIPIISRPQGSAGDIDADEQSRVDNRIVGFFGIEGTVEPGEVFLLEWVRLDEGVLDGESCAVGLPDGDDFDAAIDAFVDPVECGVGPGVLFVDPDEPPEKRLLFSRLSRNKSE